MEEGGKARTLGLQTMMEVESNEEHLQPSNREAARTFKRLKRRNLGKCAFGAMLIGGLTFLRIYSRLTEPLKLQTLTTLEKTISSVEFTDWQKIKLIAFSGLIIALLTRRSGRRVRSRLFSDV